MKRILIAAVAATAMAMFGLPARAELSNLEIVFVKADANGDLVLSKGEVLVMAIQQFEIADADGDQILEAEEIGELATDPEFSDNDSDKSGSLSIEEMIAEKLADFERIDTDKDGSLTLEELGKAYNVQ
jgi:Ca2+-binding EF-hand superfamily protein